MLYTLKVIIYGFGLLLRLVIGLPLVIFLIIVIGFLVFFFQGPAEVKEIADELWTDYWLGF